MALENADGAMDNQVMSPVTRQQLQIDEDAQRDIEKVIYQRFCLVFLIGLSAFAKLLKFNFVMCMCIHCYIKFVFLLPILTNMGVLCAR